MTTGDELLPVRVLYVDDEPGLLEIGKLFLESMGGFTVETQVSAKEALTLLDTAPYDAIVSDYQMPEMDGLSFLRRVREKHPDTPFILFTGKGREEVVIEAIDYGVDFYLQKGGDPTAQFSELAHKLRQGVRRRKAERDLTESRDYLDRIFSSVRAGILVIDTKTHLITDVNPAAADLIGLPREEIVGKQCHKYICPAEVGKCPITDLGQSVDNAERVLLMANGAQVPIIKYASPVMLQGRTCLLETFIDNTKRKEAENELQEAYGKLKQNQEEIQAAYSELAANEQVLMHDYAALRESEEQLLAIFESAYDAIFLLKAGKFVRCNKRTLEIFGCADTSEILGHSPEEFSPVHQPDGRVSAEVVAEYDRQILAGHPRRFEWVHLRRNGTLFYSEVSLSAVKLGGELYIQSIVRDISDRKHAEQAEALASRKLYMMQEFSRHEITNTVTGLLGLIDMAGKMPAGPDQELAFLEMKGRVDALLKQVEFTKEYQAVGVREPRWQEVCAMIPAQTQPRIQVSSRIRGLEVYADPLVSKIFTYLAENTAKHGLRATRIEIGAEPDGAALKIIVSDNGVGIEEDMKAGIFKRRIGGSKGMGLFLVREILEITGITIKETGIPGEGARFEIVVPEGSFRYGKTGSIPSGEPSRAAEESPVQSEEQQ